MDVPARIVIRAALAAVALPCAACAQNPPGPDQAGYRELVQLFEDWRAFQRPPVRDGVPDYTPAAIDEQRRGLPAMRARLAAIDTEGWSVSQLIDHHLVRAEMNGLDFDHRVLRPWARNPSYYTTVIGSQSDTPRREGPVIDGAIELWRLQFPLDADGVARLQSQLRAIPAILVQARGNLVGDARDLWVAGIRTQRSQVGTLTNLAGQLAAHHTDLVADAVRARDAVDGFRGWLESELPDKDGPSGVGIENYDWYLRNVHLVPYTWQRELAAMERELARAWSYLALEEHRNRDVPPLEPVAERDWQRVSNGAVTGLIRFLDEHQVMTVKPYMDRALRERLSGYSPPGSRSFFTQVDVRDPLLLRCHGVHWFDTARIELEPHPSPIRRVPLLYNIWDSRSEGLATAMEELMMGAGLFADKPRSRELVWIMVAQRAARAIAGLRMHSNEYDIDQARHFAAANTPRGWLQENGGLNWGEQALYLEQPGYGTSYITGKLLIESLLAERKAQLGDDFTLRGFMDELYASGVIPVSLIRWEMTGNRDPILQDSR